MTTLDDLVAALDEEAADSTSTSVRQPVALRRALRAAVELGFADNPNEAVNASLREALETFAQRMALEEHFAAHPQLRPSLREVAMALAVMEQDPLAERPDLVARAATEVVTVRPTADASDVLLWAASLEAHERQERESREATA